MVDDDRRERAVDPVLAVSRVGGRVLLVEGQRARRDVEAAQGRDDAPTPWTRLDLQEPEAAEHLRLQRAIGGEVAVEGAAFEDFERQAIRRDGAEAEGGRHVLVQFGVHMRERTAAHLVPVVRGERQLREAGETDLTQRDQVVEVGVGTTLEREELHQVGAIGGTGEPVVDRRDQLLVGDGAERVGDVVGHRHRLVATEPSAEALLEDELDLRDPRFVLPLLGAGERFDRARGGARTRRAGS